ncbi:hypothetical protein C4D60_Mb01t17500 [Musa balbisiana]|uniref:Uncharacterized protein n=1 Tax=Musa balbisiana TaxID=52838 RepID=A0A4S8JMY9_MUSBA|nr:hypothetical protein C4D60_Mb01t17500 [Musa balbisiana]
MAWRVDIMLHLGHSVAGVIRSNPSPIAIALLTPVGRRGGAVCFVSGATPEKKKRKMDEDEVEDEEQHTDSDNTYQGDAMRHSFGEGYSTRSDWEGFGGIYGRNPSDLISSHQIPPVLLLPALLTVPSTLAKREEITASSGIEATSSFAKEV